MNPRAADPVLERIERLLELEARRLDRVEQLLAELVARKRSSKRSAGKRARSVAERARAEVVHEPTDLDRAKARQILRRLRA